MEDEAEVEDVVGVWVGDRGRAICVLAIKG